MKLVLEGIAATLRTGVGVRITNQSEWVWRRGGIAGTDAAALVNCSAQSNQFVFVLFAEKMQIRELPAIREELKREAALRKQQEITQGTPEWHESRSKTIGATEAAGLVGAAYRDSKKLSAIQRTWEEKLPENRENWKNKPTFENRNMAEGKRLEPVARKAYEDLMGWSAEPLCVLHDSHDFIRASLDGLRGDDGLILEIKCPQPPNHSKFCDISRIEDPFERQWTFAQSFNYYRMQVLWQVLITQSPRVHFVSYSEQVQGVENRLALIELFPEPDMQEVLLQRAIEFWDYVERRELPPDWWLKPCHFPPTSNLLIP